MFREPEPGDTTVQICRKSGYAHTRGLATQDVQWIHQSSHSGTTIAGFTDALQLWPRVQSAHPGNAESSSASVHIPTVLRQDSGGSEWWCQSIMS